MTLAPAEYFQFSYVELQFIALCTANCDLQHHYR